MSRTPTYKPADFIPEILQWIAAGQTLREYCRQDGKPSYSTVYDWRDVDEDFATRFARAREIGEEIIAQECLAIANTPQTGQIVTKKSDGTTETKTADMIEHRKLQIHTRLQLLAKWNPKKYGEFMRNEVSGPDGKPIQAAITVEFVKPLNSAADVRK